MSNVSSSTEIDFDKELEILYAISRTVSRAVDTDKCLDEITHLARMVFIFDNVVLFLKDVYNQLEPSFARVVGRGKASEADLEWGETVAREVIDCADNVIREEIDGDFTKNRMKLRYYFGLPLTVGGHQVGALVFVRYGGPPFDPSNIRIPEFVAAHIALLFEHRQLIERLSSLEAERRLENLQDDFVATVSHELRTPLGFIKGYATTLLREDITWDESTRKEFLTIIDEEADRLQELIDNLLDSSRLQSGTLKMEFQPIRLDTMLKDVVLRAKSFYENLAMELDLQATGLQIQGDPTRVAQVFDNLLSNAVKYAPGSKVFLKLTQEDEHRAHISVRDNGPGIPSNHLKHLFTRFYRVPNRNSSIRGTGLGLFICRQIINAHGGEINAESTLGEGTTFHIYLPCEKGLNI